MLHNNKMENQKVLHFLEQKSNDRGARLRLVVVMSITLLAGTTLQRSASTSHESVILSNKGALGPKYAQSRAEEDGVVSKAERLLNKIFQEIHVSEPSGHRGASSNEELDPNGFHPLKTFAFTRKADYDKLKADAPDKWKITIEEHIPSFTELLYRLFKVAEKPEIQVPADKVCYGEEPPE